MKYNPEIHNRRSIRLKGYDYSGCGYYFITICTHDRQCLFGNIENGVMILNNAGRMIDCWWNELKNKYADIKIDEYVIMPNHCHGIINIVSPVSAAPIHKMVQWFKTMTTNEYIRNVKQNRWKPFNGTLWQRNYYEHIIRNETALQHIREYIVNNSYQWPQDELFPGP